MTKKKKMSTENMVIIGVSGLFMIGMVIYIINTLGVGENDDPNIKEVELEGSNKSSFINMGVPSSSKEKKEENLLDSYDRFRNDSIERSKEEGIGLPDVQNKESSRNSRLYQNDEEELVMDLKEQLSSLKKAPNAQNQRAVGGGSPRGVETAKVEKAVDPIDAKLSYHEKLLQARELRNANSQDYSANGSSGKDGEKEGRVPMIKGKASIYKDQFILPGDRVTLILSDDINLAGKLFKRNTVFYAMASINKNRVVLDITNINQEPIQTLGVRDVDDGMEGIYSKRAGELWSEFENDTKNDVGNDLGTATGTSGGRVLGSIVRGIGQMFARKGYRQSDKILLVGGDEIYILE